MVYVCILGILSEQEVLASLGVIWLNRWRVIMSWGSSSGGAGRDPRLNGGGCGGLQVFMEVKEPHRVCDVHTYLTRCLGMLHR